MLSNTTMKRITTLIILLTFFVTSSYSQEVQYQKDSAISMNVIPSKVVNYDKAKKTQATKKYKYKKKKKAVSANKLESKLTPAEKEKIKQQENKPRRGVTNLPNERTAK